MITAYSKAGCYAVLASLSGRYPPLEGRSPTCYSPVRHSVIHCWITAFDLHVLGTPPALILSQDQTLMLNALVTTLAPCSARTDRNFLTRSPVDLALALYLVRVSLLHRSLTSTSALTRFGETSAAPARLLTLDGRSLLHTTSREAACTHEHLCACTHYLVFKEPECPTRPFSHAESPPSGRFRPF